MVNYKHLFYVHSPLQVAIAIGIIERNNLLPREVLFLNLRGTRLATDEARQFAEIDVDPFQAEVNWYNWRQMLGNRRRAKAFERRVFSNVDAQFSLYSSSFIFYHHQFLKRRAQAYYLLSDGVSSLDPWATDTNGYPVFVSCGPRKRALNLLLNFSLGYRYRFSYSDAFWGMRAAQSYFYILPGSYPTAAPTRKVQLSGRFKPYMIGSMDGQFVWCTSPLVEIKAMTAERYLHLLEMVAGLLFERGVKSLSVKLHPRQLNTIHTGDYLRAVSGSGLIRVHLLDSTQPVERLAAGSDLTLICGGSSVGLYASVTGGKVYSYLNFAKSRFPELENEFSAATEAAIAKLTLPITDLPSRSVTES